jgi:hypothetical protein
MGGQRKPRFRSPEEALRFYFRAAELIASHAKPGAFSRHNGFPATPAPNALFDFLMVDSSFHDLSDVEVCVMEGLFRPTFFGVSERPLSKVCEDVKLRFPRRRWTPRRIARMKHDALTRVKEHLAREHLL